MDASALARAARYVTWLLRKTRTTITLRIECDIAAAEELIERLARYSDRVSLSLDQAVPAVARVDWSRFQVTVDRR
jgi:hypothetical protein